MVDGQTVSGARSFGIVFQQALAALLHAVRACDGLWTSSIGIIGLALNLRCVMTL